MAGGTRHSRVDLAATPNAVRWGRAHTTDVLATWRVTGTVVEDAGLVVSELLANAVRHATRPAADLGSGYDVAQCSLLLFLTRRGLTVMVYDGDRRPPVLQRPASDSEQGRGLLLVEALSEEWGYTYPFADSGKLVWARLSVPPEPGHPSLAAYAPVSTGIASSA
jgi:anti-sigma regulatory factor (Ser/Thr protein kinase)